MSNQIMQWYEYYADTKFTDAFRAIVKSSHVEPLKLPAQSPNLNAYAERWVKFVLLFPTATQAKNRVDGSVGGKERLGGLLKYYHREAA